MSYRNDNKGCGCSSIPISLLMVLLGLGYWGTNVIYRRAFPPDSVSSSAQIKPAEKAINNLPSPIKPPALQPELGKANNAVNPPVSSPSPVQSPVPKSDFEKKAIRGIYLSRYQVTNNADEQTIRSRVRYYRKQGFNAIIHGVWGNGCTMYDSQVMLETFGYKSCPNLFQDQWLDWLIDEAHKQGMQVHAYFEKGIKIDKNSPIYELAVSKGWLVPGVDKTYAGIDHYVLDVEKPEVAKLFTDISVEFVKKYPQIDAIQWDDYLGYYAELGGKLDRTEALTKFVQGMRWQIKQANPRVSFDICHHNPYWAKRYFAADWKNWNIDRVFIQTYNDANFATELDYAVNYGGVAISERQLYRLKSLVKDNRIKNIMIFPLGGNPENVASQVKSLTKN